MPIGSTCSSVAPSSRPVRTPSSWTRRACTTRCGVSRLARNERPRLRQRRRSLRLREERRSTWPAIQQNDSPSLNGDRDEVHVEGHSESNLALEYIDADEEREYRRQPDQNVLVSRGAYGPAGTCPDEKACQEEDGEEELVQSNEGRDAKCIRGPREIANEKERNVLERLNEHEWVVLDAAQSLSHEVRGIDEWSVPHFLLRIHIELVIERRGPRLARRIGVHLDGTFAIHEVEPARGCVDLKQSYRS